MVIKVFEVVLI